MAASPVLMQRADLLSAARLSTWKVRAWVWMADLLPLPLSYTRRAGPGRPSTPLGPHLGPSVLLPCQQVLSLLQPGGALRGGVTR